MKIVALYSIKGGVGKTAAAVNLSYLAAKGSMRTLLCDLDPQAAASFYFRVQPQDGFGRKALLKGGRRLAEGVRGSDYERLDLLPASLSFRKLDMLLDDGGRKGGLDRLSDSLRSLDGDYDMIFLDCPPNLTLLSESVFNASDIVLSPLIPTSLSVMSFEKLLDFFDDKELDKAKLRPFLSMVESRKKMHSEASASLRKNCSGIFKAYIPYASDVERMGFLREPLCHSRPSCAAALAYSGLWDELKGILFNKGRKLKS